ncbi:DNA-binding transcriptional regulator, MarR family [Brevibacterium sandarakinum]|uniref:DNA-binding transcriptional regulator, MarR family n=1 Tax=Brevibacterium sandarakinum TaxID=629680 RepID=A0A1H1P0N2_BRESA|nr:MarR family winged helix-turn-helix transcriptional regulator [Brevibacterium sandarakinum]SDS04590.1 DNA-binding transcriptional regulator, MarR family [Brevibacterium sandarakinum]
MIPHGTTAREEQRSQAGEELSPSELAAWRGMLRLTHRLRRDLGEQLSTHHDLSMADYDVLVALAAAPDRSMRMSELADIVLQPRSSLSRIVGSLERRRLVQRSRVESDARGSSAALTAEGYRLFAQAHRTHIAGVRHRFLEHLSTDQLEDLATAWKCVDPDVEHG